MIFTSSSFNMVVILFMAVAIVILGPMDCFQFGGHHYSHHFSLKILRRSYKSLHGIEATRIPFAATRRSLPFGVPLFMTSTEESVQSTFQGGVSPISSSGSNSYTSESESESEIVVDLYSNTSIPVSSEQPQNTSVPVPKVVVSKDGKKRYIQRSVRTQIEEHAAIKDAAWKSVAVGKQLETSSFKFTNNLVIFSLPSNIQGILSPRYLSEEESRSLTTFKTSRQPKDRLLVEVNSTNIETNQVELKLLKIIRDVDYSAMFANLNKSASYNGTVIRNTEAGILVKLDGFNAVGVITPSRLMGFSKSQLLQDFPVDGKIIVRIDEVDTLNNRISLLIDSPSSDVSLFAEFSDARWLHGVVEAVSKFGLFVRPVGQDAIGLVHGREIPKDLIEELKVRHNMSSLESETILPRIFNKGDIIRARVTNADIQSNRLDLSMLPPEPEERYGQETMVKVNYREVIDGCGMYDVLLWHNGTKFEAPPEPHFEVDDDSDLLEDPDEVNDRNWRRLFEIDADADSADFETNAIKAFQENLDREIGAMKFLLEEEDEYMVSPGYEHLFPTKPKAVIKALEPIPEEILNALNGTFFEKEYRLSDKDIKYPSFSYEGYWGPIADELEAQLKARKEARSNLRRGGGTGPAEKSTFGDTDRGEPRWQKRKNGVRDRR